MYPKKNADFFLYFETNEVSENASYLSPFEGSKSENIFQGLYKVLKVWKKLNLTVMFSRFGIYMDLNTFLEKCLIFNIVFNQHYHTCKPKIF